MSRTQTCENLLLCFSVQNPKMGSCLLVQQRRKERDMLVVENKKPSQVAMVAGRLCRTLLDLDKLSKDVEEIHTDLEK